MFVALENIKQFHLHIAVLNKQASYIKEQSPKSINRDNLGQGKRKNFNDIQSNWSFPHQLAVPSSGVGQVVPELQTTCQDVICGSHTSGDEYIVFQTTQCVAR